MLAEGKQLHPHSDLLLKVYRLGKSYATFFGSRGANVVVNDLGGSFKGDGESSKVGFLQKTLAKIINVLHIGGGCRCGGDPCRRWQSRCKLR